MPVETCQKYTGTLSEILALTPVVQTIADATDVPGVRLEWMNGAWYGDCGFPSAAQHSALLAANAYNSLAAGGVTCTISGVQYTWQGAAGGGWTTAIGGISYKFRDIKTRIESGESPLLAFIGESTTRGWGSVDGTLTVDSDTTRYSFPSFVAESLRNAGIPSAVCTYSAPGFKDLYGSYDGNWKASGFSAITIGIGESSCWTATTVGSTLSFSHKNDSVPRNFVRFGFYSSSPITLKISINETGESFTRTFSTVGMNSIDLASASILYDLTTTLTLVSGAQVWAMFHEVSNKDICMVKIANLGIDGSGSVKFASDPSLAYKTAGVLNFIAPNLAVICLGINDAVAGVTQATFQSNISSIISGNQWNSNCKIYLMDTIQSQESQYQNLELQYIAALDSICSGFNSAIKRIRLPQELLFSADSYWDHLHPSASRYGEIGKFIAKQILQ